MLGFNIVLVPFISKPDVFSKKKPRSFKKKSKQTMANLVFDVFIFAVAGMFDKLTLTPKKGFGPCQPPLFGF